MEREEKGKEKLEAMELEIPAKHPRAIEGNVMIFNIILSVIGAIIGLQILTTLGITPNTAIIGVLLAICLRCLRACGVCLRGRATVSL
jgi:hypothetical protein